MFDVRLPPPSTPPLQYSITPCPDAWHGNCCIRLAMIRNFLSDVATVTIGKALDACGLRHRAIANNVANVDTPGFTRSDVSFESQLKSVLTSEDQESVMDRLEELQPEVQPDTVSPAGPDGNNVSVDKEMADLVKNSLEYEALVQLANLKGFMIRTAIREGK